MSYKIAPSLLAADFGHLAEAVKMVDRSQADWLHLDVMDGQFVPNISFGLPVIKDLRSYTNKFFDVHLMIERPEQYIEAFREVGADLITVHVEACTHLHRTLQQIRATGAQAGVALNPHTPVEAVYDILEETDMVLIMSVNPGYGGQKFIYRTLDKIKRLRSEVTARNLKLEIEVDGGVGLQNMEALLQAGASVLVAGSSIFHTENPEQTIQRMKSFSAHTIF